MIALTNELKKFLDIGHSIEECLHKAVWGIKEHIDLLRAKGGILQWRGCHLYSFALADEGLEPK